jgi:hypothetical protein
MVLNELNSRTRSWSASEASSFCELALAQLLDRAEQRVERPRRQLGEHERQQHREDHRGEREREALAERHRQSLAHEARRHADADRPHVAAAPPDRLHELVVLVLLQRDELGQRALLEQLRRLGRGLERIADERLRSWPRARCRSCRRPRCTARRDTGRSRR